MKERDPSAMATKWTGNYFNANAINEQYGMDSEKTNADGVERLIDRDLLDKKDPLWGAFPRDHSICFWPSSKKVAGGVLWITTPYAEDTAELRAGVEAFADRFRLSSRVNNPADKVYAPEDTLPPHPLSIAFWRADRIDLSE